MDHLPPGYRTQSEDTSHEVERLLIEAYRRMPASEKAHRIVETCRAVERSPSRASAFGTLTPTQTRYGDVWQPSASGVRWP